MQAATAHELKKQDNIKATTSAIKETAKNLYNKINEPFKETFNINFNEALAKIPQLQLQVKKSSAILKNRKEETSKVSETKY